MFDWMLSFSIWHVCVWVSKELDHKKKKKRNAHHFYSHVRIESYIRYAVRL